jgi:hypothetical protein
MAATMVGVFMFFSRIKNVQMYLFLHGEGRSNKNVNIGILYAPTTSQGSSCTILVGEVNENKTLPATTLWPFYLTLTT